MDINDLTKEKQEKLDELFEEEIVLLKENKITKEEFIKIVKLKTGVFLDLYYLINKYIGRVIIVDNMLEEIKNHLSSGNSYIDTKDTLDINYISSQKQTRPHIKHLKKIEKYDKKSNFYRDKRYK